MPEWRCERQYNHGRLGGVIHCSMHDDDSYRKAARKNRYSIPRSTCAAQDREALRESRRRPRRQFAWRNAFDAISRWSLAIGLCCRTGTRRSGSSRWKFPNTRLDVAIITLKNRFLSRAAKLYRRRARPHQATREAKMRGLTFATWIEQYVSCTGPQCAAGDRPRGSLAPDRARSRSQA